MDIRIVNTSASRVLDMREMDASYPVDFWVLPKPFETAPSVDSTQAFLLGSTLDTRELVEDLASMAATEAALEAAGAVPAPSQPKSNSDAYISSVHVRTSQSESEPQCWENDRCLDNKIFEVQQAAND